MQQVFIKSQNAQHCQLGSKWSVFQKGVSVVEKLVFSGKIMINSPTHVYYLVNPAFKVMVLLHPGHPWAGVQKQIYGKMTMHGVHKLFWLCVKPNNAAGSDKIPS